jgi:hypothetical protein
MSQAPPDGPALSRRHVLHILTALGFSGALAESLAAGAAPTVSPDALRAAAALLGGALDERRLQAVQPAVQRNLDQLQVVRDLELPDDVEPAVQFLVRRS